MTWLTFSGILGPRAGRGYNGAMRNVVPETIPSQPETDAPSDRAPDAVWSMADPHFHEGDPALGTFFAWLEAFRRSGTPDLVLLGDLFRVWVGLPGAQGREQREVLGALGALASEGRRVVYVVGNRDYFAEEAGRAAGMLVSEGWGSCATFCAGSACGHPSRLRVKTARPFSCNGGCRESAGFSPC